MAWGVCVYVHRHACAACGVCVCAWMCVCMDVNLGWTYNVYIIASLFSGHGSFAHDSEFPGDVICMLNLRHCILPISFLAYTEPVQTDMLSCLDDSEHI